MPSLLVDLGLKTGLALFAGDGRLIWYGSHNYGTTERLKRGAPDIPESTPDLTELVIEGGGKLANVWEKEAQRRGINLTRTFSEEWRQLFLYPREQRSGPDAKRHTGEIARKVVEWANASRPTALRHDTAEAIMIGLWGLLNLG
jgi:hypothetical protein